MMIVRVNDENRQQPIHEVIKLESDKMYIQEQDFCYNISSKQFQNKIMSMRQIKILLD